MRKITSLLMTILAAFYGSVNAQEAMDSYLVNPGFENPGDTTLTIATSNGGVWAPQGWTVDYPIFEIWDQGVLSSGLNGKGESLNVTASEGERYYYARLRWAANTLTLSQKLETLPSGKYKITCQAKAPDAATYPTELCVNANELTLSHTATGTGDYEALEVTFNVLADNDPVTVYFRMNHSNTNAEMCLFLDDFHLYRLGAADADEVMKVWKDRLDPLADALNSVTEYDVPGALYKKSKELYDYAEALEYTVAAYKVAVDSLTDFMVELETGREAFEKFGALAEEVFIYCDVPEGERYPGYDVFYAEAERIRLDVYENPDATTESTIAATEELKQAFHTYRLSEAELASVTNPVDLSWMITNPSMADATTKGWTVNNVTSGGDFNCPVKGERTCWNSWSDNFTSMDYYQVMSAMPEGMYTLSCLAMTTEGSLHDQHAYISSVAGKAVSDNMTVDNAFDTPEGWEPLTTKSLYVGSDGSFRIGFESTSGGGTAGWFCVTDFGLTYYGKDLSAAEEALKEKIAQAQMMIDTAVVKIVGVEKKTLQEAVNTGNSATTSEEINSAYAVINTAVYNASVSITRYNEVMAIINEADEWINSGSFTDQGIEKLGLLVQNQQTILADDTTSNAAFSGMKAILLQGIKDLRLEVCDKVTDQSPVDLTFILVNPTIDVANSAWTVQPEGWTIKVSGAGNTNVTWGGERDDTSDTYLNGWSGTAGSLKYTATQTITGLRNGLYRLSAAVRTSGDGSYVIAEASKGVQYKALAQVLELEGGDCGNGFNTTVVDNINVNDGTITIGASNDAGVTGDASWNGYYFTADDFKLYYISTSYDPDLRDIETVSDTDKQSLNVYVENGMIRVEGVDRFTLSTLDGITLRTDVPLIPGIYLVRAGDQVVKVAVK